MASTTDTPARNAAVELLSALSPAAFIVDADRAVDIAAEFLTLQRDTICATVTAEIERRARKAERVDAEVWGLAMAAHLRTTGWL